jgi:hypothetical protein
MAPTACDEICVVWGFISTSLTRLHSVTSDRFKSALPIYRNIS